MGIKRLSLFILLISCQASLLSGQNSKNGEPAKNVPLTRILFVFDASQSMSGTWESDEKINIARQILVDIVDSLENIEHVEMALRVYGHQSPVPPQDCSDTKLEVPFSPNSASRIRQKLRFITPKGTTPIASSLGKSVKDFPECDNCRNIIVLITDGIEACDGDPCEVSKELQTKGIVLKPFVIGIGLDPGFRETFDCVGYYYNALEENKFKQTLGFVINQVLNSTTAQVNILDENGFPTETNVNMTFYDRYSGRIMYNYIHTMNHKGIPDTLELDHLVTYRLKLHTIPPVEVDSISITPGKHTIIGVDAPQGYLSLKTARGKLYEGLSVIIRQDDSTKTLHNQAVGQIEKYIIGKYDLEIPTIPRLYIDDIEILQSHTTTLEIPEPGTVTLNAKTPGHGSLYTLDDNDQKFVINLNPTLRQQAFFLQPGFYRLTFRNGNIKKAAHTNVLEFEVKSGESTVIDLF